MLMAVLAGCYEHYLQRASCKTATNVKLAQIFAMWVGIAKRSWVKATQRRPWKSCELD